jgi:hypothetical protein
VNGKGIVYRFDIRDFWGHTLIDTSDPDFALFYGTGSEPFRPVARRPAHKYRTDPRLVGEDGAWLDDTLTGRWPSNSPDGTQLTMSGYVLEITAAESGDHGRVESSAFRPAMNDG